MLGLALAAALAATDFDIGDIFAGVEGGQYVRLSPEGVVLETLDVGIDDHAAGCALDAQGNLYGTAFLTSTTVRLDAAHPHQRTWSVVTGGVEGPTPDRLNECLALLDDERLLVGHADTLGGGDFHVYDLAGSLLDEQAVPAGTRGADWFDLANDGCTVFFTSESTLVRRWDLCARASLPDFASAPAGSRLYALRLLPPGDGSGGLLVAAGSAVLRLDAAGAVVQTYGALDEFWFALSLDPDRESFWSAGNFTRNLYRFHIESGALLRGPILVPARSGGSLDGLCIFGEPIAADCTTYRPERVEGLRGIRSARDATFLWRTATDQPTAGYNVWAVVNGDKALIPVANSAEAAINSAIQGICLSLPRASPLCTDTDALDPPPLLFYQVRGSCANGTEGTDHP